NGEIHVHPTRRAEPGEWAYALAHCLLHLGFGHFQGQAHQREWDLACDIAVYRFLDGMKFGSPPADLADDRDLAKQTSGSEALLYQKLCREGFDARLLYSTLTGTTESDMRFAKTPKEPNPYSPYGRISWEETFAHGLQNAVIMTVDLVGATPGKSARLTKMSRNVRLARNWFMDNFPLLGAIAGTLDFIEDPLVCQRAQVSIAAINTYSKEIFLNPAAGLDQEELRFVIAHELLHAALRHDVRREGRDPYLWNVACDYVINLWLMEMQVGRLPRVGVLYDESLKGMSAESIYDLIVRDLRRYRKLQTMRGFGASDVLEGPTPGWWLRGDGVTLDEFYRNAIAQGLCHHQSEGRGFLPAGLVEEIRSLSQPPIPWDVKLAHWFDEYFPPVEKRRSYARLSRRQSSSPEIPIPRYVNPEQNQSRTFGVVLDTSGSMARTLLAQSLGAIASYAISRDVNAIRLISCDAAAYDHGYMPPEEIADRVLLKGRGGTILQPGIDMLERAIDFPPAAPVLLITDGWCDCFQTSRDHAILLPAGRTLPFIPRCPVFRFFEK
ncbi:MAG: VWA-like domain-containing protein, partial [Bryobacteraceae bacterium]